MEASKKPAFHLWDRPVLEELTHDLWDDNQNLRTANEQLRLDNKDLSKQLRQLLTNKDDWK
jgi:hypothetical protein